MSWSLSTTLGFLSVVSILVVGGIFIFWLSGAVLLRFVGITDDEEILLLSPLAGMVLLGAGFSVVFSLVPYNGLTLVVSWVGTFGLFSLYGGRIRLPRGQSFASGLAFGACVVLGIFSVTQLIPIFESGAFYIGAPIYDHGKVALVDALAREGLPPLTPYLAPGRTLPLNYYFYWHFLASQLKFFPHVAGMHADVAMTWITMSAVLMLCVRMARFVGASWLGAAVTVVLLFGQRILPLPGLSPLEGFATTLPQATWVPQHLLAGACVVLLLRILALFLLEPSPKLGLFLGLVFGCAFGSSIWIALGFLLTLPPLVIAAYPWLRIGRLNGTRLKWLGAGALCAMLAASPVFAAATRGSGQISSSGGIPIELSLWDTTSWFENPGIEFSLYWLYLLPLVYGLAGWSGAAGLLGLVPTKLGAELYRRLAVGATIGFLLVSQLARSTIANNDLGWRAQIVSYLLLCVFGGPLLECVYRGGGGLKEGWQRGVRCCRLVFLVLAVPVALYSVSSLRGFVDPDEFPGQTASRSSFTRTQSAWRTIQAHTLPGDIVQMNPRAYNSLTPWRQALSFTLFADRKSAVGDISWSYFYSSRADPELRQLALKIVADVFDGSEPEAGALNALRHVLKVKALLVTDQDPGWQSRKFEDSAIYQLVETTETYRVYVSSD